MKLTDFKHDDWIKIWAGTWSFLSCSHFGKEYTRLIRFGPRPFVAQCVIFLADGKSECWITQSDRDILGKYLAGEILKNPDKAVAVCKTLKNEVDKILNFIDKNIAKEITLSDLRTFWQNVVTYYKPHIFVKYVVDYLEPALLKKLLPHFEEARVYAEPVFKRTEDFIIALTKSVAAKTKISADLVLYFTEKEMENFLSKNKLPALKVLIKRKKSAMLFDERDFKICVKKDIEKIKSFILSAPKENILKGSVAFPGKACGRARIVLDPAKVGHFEQGDVLVAGMTRPEYLPIMKKSSAIITDAGGILCHAAITARELHIPCIIGTKIATKVFKDGDMVEVDAERGVVRKLEAK